MTTTSHSNCDHEATKAARAQCRKDRAAGLDKARDLISAWGAFDADYTWLRRAARRFANWDGDNNDLLDMAMTIINCPTMQDTDYNRRNGYTPYTSARELYSRILRASS